MRASSPRYGSSVYDWQAMKALPPVVVVCLIGIGFAMKAETHHYGESHSARTIAVLLGIVVATICVAVCVTVLVPKARRVIRRSDRFAGRKL